MDAISTTPERAPPCPAAVREAKKWDCRDFLGEHAEDLRSFAVSIIEACSRGSDIAAITHTQQAWKVMLGMRSVAKTLRALDADLPPPSEGEAP
jgi:hypothetical protein